MAGLCKSIHLISIAGLTQGDEQPFTTHSRGQFRVASRPTSASLLAVGGNCMAGADSANHCTTVRPVFINVKQYNLIPLQYSNNNQSYNLYTNLCTHLPPREYVKHVKHFCPFP